MLNVCGIVFFLTLAEREERKRCVADASINEYKKIKISTARDLFNGQSRV